MQRSQSSIIQINLILDKCLWRTLRVIKFIIVATCYK